MAYNRELIECSVTPLGVLNDILKYLHNTPLSDSLPLVSFFWGCPVTPSNGGFNNTLSGVVEEWTFKLPKQLL